MSGSLRPELRLLVGWELRRLWRGPLPWLLAALAPVTWAINGRWQAPALMRHDHLMTWIPLVPLLLSGLAAWTVQSRTRSGIDDVLLAWPVASWRLALAQTLGLSSVTLVVWLGIAIPSLAYALYSYAGGARAAGSAPWVLPALRDGAAIALSLAASFLGAQALGQVAGVLLPGLAAPVALIIFRVGALVGPGVVMGTLQWPWVLLANPELAYSGWSPYADGFGLSLHRRFFLTHRLFWLVGSLGVLAVLVFARHARRDAPRTPSRAIAALALCVTLASALPFAAHEAGRARAHAWAVAEFGAPVKPGFDPGAGPGGAPLSPPTPPAPLPLRYDLAVDLRRAPQADVVATVELIAGPEVPRDTVTFTLRRAFQVDEVLLQGAPLPPDRVQRERDLLRLVPPGGLVAGQAFTVTLRYHGRVEDWRLDPYETPVALATTELLLIPAGWGWYPVPGEHRLTWEIGLSSMVYRALADRTQPFHDSEPLFDVTMQAPTRIRSLAGFEREEGSPGQPVWRLRQAANRLALVGGDWWTFERDGIEYAVPLEELDTWEVSTDGLHRLLVAARDWTGFGSLTIVPHLLPRLALQQPAMEEVGMLGASYQAPALPGSLSHALQSWLQGQCRLQEPGQEGSFDAYSYFAALQAYLTRQIFRRALGPDAAQGAYSYLWTGQDTQPLTDGWAARTPLERQKEQVRALFAAGRQRLVGPEDLEFLLPEAGR